MKIKSIIPNLKLLKWFLQKLFYFYFIFGRASSKKFIKKNFNKKNIAIFACNPWGYLTPFEILLFKYYQLLGINISYFIYDQNIPINELNRADLKLSRKYELAMLRKLGFIGKSFLSIAGINYKEINFRDHQDIQNINSLFELKNYKYKSIAVGSHAIESTYRYFKSYNLKEESLLIAKLYLKLACSNIDYFIKTNMHSCFSEVFISHGIYASWGPIAEYCKKNNIKYIAYDRGKENNTFTLCLNKPAPEVDIQKAWIRFKNKNLDQSQENYVSTLLKSRETHSNDIFQYNTSEKTLAKSELNKIKTNLGLDLNKKTICFYSNLIWDAANTSRNLFFRDFQECIEETINKLSNNNSVQFLLRPHPAEYVLGSNEKYVNLLSELILQKKLFVANMEINSFDVINLSDLDIVNTSTIGIEAAAYGKPVFVVSETHFKDKGFTYDCENKESFFDKVEYVLAHGIHNKKDVIENSRKYLYLMMNKYQIKSPLNYEKNKFIKYKFEKFETIYNSKFAKVLDHIITEDAEDAVMV
tara:strand:+ start:7052 stop:8638 length:1587 start_codon:yes stop_codon:yes gene_type:complete